MQSQRNVMIGDNPGDLQDFPNMRNLQKNVMDLFQILF